MNEHTGDELEDRLRRTYDAVAEHTEVTGDETFALRPGPASSHRRWALPALVAALTGLIVGGLAVIGRNGTDPVTDTPARHVLPTYMAVPADATPFGRGRALPLVSITSDVDTDVLAYASNALSVTVRVERTPVAPIDGESIEVRHRETATLDGDDAAGRLRWKAPDGPAVTIEWSGAVDDGVDGIVDVVDGLVLVDDETWASETEFAGFTLDQRLLQRRVGPAEVFLGDDLQSGLKFWINGNGFTPTNFADEECRPIDVVYGETWSVVSLFPSGTVTATWPDGVEVTTELERLVPGSYFGVGVISRDLLDEPVEPDVVCEEGP